MAGLELSMFKNLQAKDAYGINKVLGIPYAKFWRVDLEYKAYLPVLKKSTLALRSFAGLGKTYATNAKSLPFDFGFFGGGANDNRGFRARSMTPGNYENFLDSNRVATQIGDVQLSLNAELRFPITSLIKGALFLDAGNIWTSDTDPNRVGSKFTKDFYKQLTLATGIGFRFDLSFFIIRLDIGVPLRNPSYPTNAQWIWDSRQGIKDRINAFNLNKSGYVVVYDSKLFQPQIHFGIGLPF
jgi:outer membrane protein insertion porin family